MRREFDLDTYVQTKRAKRTQIKARSLLTQFLNYIFPGEEADPNVLSIRYLHSQQDHFTNLQNFIRSYSTNHAPLSINDALTAVSMWMEWNEISLTPTEKNIIKSMLPRAVVVTEDDVLTIGLIQQILSHADVMLRAYILMLASSGMRAAELANIRFDDLRQNDTCNHIYIPAERMKARRPHTYRYSGEARRELNEFLKIRDKYSEAAINKTKNCLHKGVQDRDDRVFPVDYYTIRYKFIAALKAAGLARRGSRGRYTITLQSFRRWFDSTLKLHISTNMANEIIGHDEGLSSNYRRYPADQVDAAYADVEKYLIIQAPSDYTTLKDDVAGALKEQQSTTAILATRVIQMEQSMEEMRSFVSSIKNYEKMRD